MCAVTPFVVFADPIGMSLLPLTEAGQGGQIEDEEHIAYLAPFWAPTSPPILKARARPKRWSLGITISFRYRPRCQRHPQRRRVGRWQISHVIELHELFSPVCTNVFLSRKKRMSCISHRICLEGICSERFSHLFVLTFFFFGSIRGPHIGPESPGVAGENPANPLGVALLP
jgi:hypothetical protein